MGTSHQMKKKSYIAETQIKVNSSRMSDNSVTLSLLAVDALADDFEQIVGVVSSPSGTSISSNSTLSTVSEELTDAIEAIEQEIEEKKLQLLKLKNALRRQTRLTGTPTTHENAAFCVVVKNRNGEFYRQIHNDRDGTLYYLTDGGRKTLLTLSATKVLTAVVREGGGQVLDGRRGPSVHYKDLSAQPPAGGETSSQNN